MKIYQIVFTFKDPSKAMGTIMAESPELAIEKIKADIAENSPGITDFEVLSVEEILETAHDAEDFDPSRTLN